jgi:hypothetical protein
MSYPTELINAININELGELSYSGNVLCGFNYRTVRTGTLHTGAVGPSRCLEFTSTLANQLGIVGHASSVDSTWTNCAAMACNSVLPIVCFQQ